MAFNPIWKGDYAAPTVKSEQDVIVQIVEVTDRDGGNATHRIDVRVQENGPRYQGPTKVGFGFGSAADAEELIIQLQAAVNEFVRQNLGNVKAPAAAAPKEPMVRRRQPNPAAPRAKAAAGGPAKKRPAPRQRRNAETPAHLA